MDSDFRLIWKMKQGREDAMELFIRKYYDEIFRYCTCHCHDTQYGEDLTQEVFIRFFTGLSSYEYRGKTKNYLYTIAGNLVCDFHRRRREMPVERQLFEQKSGEGEALEQAAERVDMEHALAQLPEEFREDPDFILFSGAEIKRDSGGASNRTSFGKIQDKKGKKGATGTVMLEGRKHLWR